jgi:hypothetical protein
MSRIPRPAERGRARARAKGRMGLGSGRITPFKLSRVNNPVEPPRKGSHLGRLLRLGTSEASPIERPPSKVLAPFLQENAMILARKPTVTTLLSVVFTALLIAALAAQSAPQAAADPSLSLACAACSKGISEAVAALEAMRLVLLNGRSVAHFISAAPRCWVNTAAFAQRPDAAVCLVGAFCRTGRT